MVTDTARKRKTDAGNPDICPFYETFHAIYSDAETIEWVRSGCTGASIGCIECKRSVIPKVLESLAPIRERRAELAADPQSVFQILNRGEERAKAIAMKTMAEVRQSMGLVE